MDNIDQATYPLQRLVGRLGFHHACHLQGFPIGTIGVVYERYMKRTVDKFALTGVATCSVTHFFWKSQCQANMGAILGVSNGRKTTCDPFCFPTLLIFRVELVWLAHVMAEGTGKELISVNRQLGKKS